MYGTLAERLWAKCERQPNGCLEWQGNRYGRGYGQMQRGARGAGLLGTHRAAWEATHGPIPEGMQVCHTCDNPPCCDPAHLFLGTFAENMADRKAKGRTIRGEAIGTSKFTDAQIRRVRVLAAEGWTQARIASEIGCARSYVSRLLAGICRAAT